MNDKWYESMSYVWKKLALMRDFHDHMCGRDKKHETRIKACYNFLPTVKYTMEHLDEIKRLSNTIPIILRTKNVKYTFIHPVFEQFNN